MISWLKTIHPLWASSDIITQVIILTTIFLVLFASYSIVKCLVTNIFAIIKTVLSKLSPFFKKLHHINIKGGSISLDADDRQMPNKVDGAGYSSHRDCPRYADILNLIQAQKELYRERHRIQRKIDRIYDILILKDQMHHAEYQIEEMINLAETLFSQILRASNSTLDIFASREYREFKGLLELIRDKMVIKIRLMCRDNHFAEKTESEFVAYTKMQNSLIQSFIREKAYFYFPYGSEIKDYQSMTKMYDSISDSVESFLYTAREITKSKIAEAEELEKEIEALELEFDTKFGVLGA